MAAKAKKPAKPYPDFPLYAHAGGVWAKKIRGQVYYFGPWDDWQAAKANFDAKKHALYAGDAPPILDPTVGDLLDQFLGGKDTQLKTGEISQDTFAEYESLCEIIDSHFGPNRPLDTLRLTDFQALKLALAKEKCKCKGNYRFNSLQRKLEKTEFQKLRDAIKAGKTFNSTLGKVKLADPNADVSGKWKDIKSIELKVAQKCACESTVSAVSLKRRLTIARMIFASQPLELRKALKSPPQKQLRKEARKRGPRFYEADDLRKLVKAADPHLRAMILLGVNCGMGNKDCITLPSQYVDLKNGWHNYYRPKTEVDRRCKLWPETVRALKAIAGDSLIFNGRKWDRWVVGSEFDKLCRLCKVESHGFYSLRRTFETIAGASGCQQFVVDKIMGHSRPNDMAATYRQKVFDRLIEQCTDFVRGWYLGKITID